MKKRKFDKTIIEKCSKVKLIITDVDGVLTDGGMYYTENGEMLKKFNTRDGMGVELLLSNKIKTIFMTKENSQIVKKRAEKVKAAAVYLNVQNKDKELKKICRKFKITSEEIAYIGDDVNDIPIMKKIGFSLTPADGNVNVKKISDYVCLLSGGQGVFREAADMILALKS